MGRPYFDLVLPTTKHERVLGLSTLSYQMAYEGCRYKPCFFVNTGYCNQQKKGINHSNERPLI